MKRLWEQPPLNGISDVRTALWTEKGNVVGLMHPVNGFNFVPLISSASGWNAVAERRILLLRPNPPENHIGAGGDLDNRMKLLFDAL